MSSRRKLAVVAVALAVGLVVPLGGCGSSAPEPLSVSQGGDVDDYHAQLPVDWPSVVPLPVDMNLDAAGREDLPEGATYSASYSGTRSLEDVVAAMSEAFRDGGFTSDRTYGDPADTKVTAWHNGALTVQLVVTDEGQRTMVNVTAVAPSAGG